MTRDTFRFSHSLRQRGTRSTYYERRACTFSPRKVQLFAILQSYFEALFATFLRSRASSILSIFRAELSVLANDQKCYVGKRKLDTYAFDTLLSIFGETLTGKTSRKQSICFNDSRTFLQFSKHQRLTINARSKLKWKYTGQTGSRSVIKFNLTSFDTFSPCC